MCVCREVKNVVILLSCHWMTWRSRIWFGILFGEDQQQQPQRFTSRWGSVYIPALPKSWSRLEANSMLFSLCRPACFGFLCIDLVWKMRRRNFVIVFAPIRWAPVWWSSASFGVFQTFCLRVDASISPGQNFGSGPPASVHQTHIFGNPEEQQRMWKQSWKL